MKYSRRPIVVEAITFKELVQYGIDSGASLWGDLPWSFEYKGHPVSHEHNQCYLILTPEGTIRFTTDDMLISEGELMYVMNANVFHTVYKRYVEYSD